MTNDNGKNKATGSRGVGRRIVKTVLISFVLLVIGVTFYAFKIEPKWVETTRYNVKFEDYPAGAPPMKIAFIADTHVGPHNDEAFIRRAVDSVNELEPDVVLLGGDFVSAIQYAEPCARAFSALKTKRRYAIFGGHDYQEGAATITHEFKKTGIPVMKNGNINLGRDVWLIAIDDIGFGKPDIKKAFAGVPENSVRVSLTHNPQMFPRIKNMNTLTVTGHTHAGQLDIPGVPRNQLPGLMGFEYIRGWYADGDSRLYVNRGLATVVPYFRFRARPEITLFTITKGTPGISGMRKNEPINRRSLIRRAAVRFFRLLKPIYMKVKSETVD